MRRWLWRVCMVVSALALLLAATVWWLLRGSLPSLDGDHALPGLGAPVTVSRDARGVVTLEGASQRDVLAALGYVHAQERGFEMDLMRRSAAGELAALFGPAAVQRDQRMRVHRLRARASAEPVSDALRAYVDGVNRGMDALPVRPWPYLLLRQRPAPWQPSDSLLTGLAMYADLQDPDNQRELAMSRLREVMPPALFKLLAHNGSSWDAPLFGGPRGDAVLPTASELDLRGATPAGTARAAEAEVHGSNNFAVAGALTADGRAILADDMHLGLRAPGLWFRVRLRYPDPQAPDGQVDVSGFSLPGLPAVVVGSNGHVAWGFTNSYIDTADYRRIPPDAPVQTHRETIEVAGADPVTLQVRETDWGPILHTRADGSHDALRWTAHLPGAISLDLAELARAADVDQALHIADHARLPAQNLLLADSQGRIAWRLIGARPDRRTGCVPDAAAQVAARCPAWGIRSDAAPALVDPADHRLWTANGRVLEGPDLAVAGDGGYDLGARGAQIRDGLRARAQFNEHDLLAIQLDDRALLLGRWHTLLQRVLADADAPALEALRNASAHWDGRASVDSVSYRIVRGFRGRVIDSVQDGLLAPARQTLGEDWVAPRLGQFEGVLWPLVSEQPAHLLPAGFASWDALLLDAATQLQAELAAQGPLHERTWGERNTAAICHPTTLALPALLGRWLCMPRQPLPGDRDMPRVQGPAFGASQRMVVAPGHEADGIVQMPGGQSGHPLSPYWGVGHDDWVQGRPAPFLPGAAEHTLILRSGAP